MRSWWGRLVDGKKIGMAKGSLEKPGKDYGRNLLAMDIPGGIFMLAIFVIVTPKKLKRHEKST
jgi:hypothetical protein